MGRLLMIIMCLLVTVLSLASNATTVCVDSCSGQSNGNYQHCSDCQKYVTCSNGYKYIMPCPSSLVWDDVKKRCDYTSLTCSLSASASTEKSVTPKTITQASTGSCVDSCAGVEDGDYQNCQNCFTFVSCSNEAKYIMPCPSQQVWDDNVKRCLSRSSTCTPN